MIDTAQSAPTADDERVHLSKACREIIPLFYGDSIAPVTATRWIKRGLRTPDGRRVKLKAFRVGRQIVTSRRWIAEFFEELEADVPTEKSDQSSAGQDVIDARLKAAGLV